MLDTFLASASHPVALMLGVIALAWLWEDAALISAAILAADGRLEPLLAVIAVFVGISSGDLALYYLGRFANRWRWLRRWILTNPQSRHLARRFRQRTLSNIMIIRFIPGLRTLGFTMCGLWKIALYRFLSAMAIAGLVWIALIFSLVYGLGSSAWLQDSDWKWSLMGIALLLLVFNNFWVRKAATLRASR